ncbi:MAG: hypothetical protein QM756_34145 [Polyangiaceae bacterium]
MAPTPKPEAREARCDVLRIELGGGTFSRALSYRAEQPGPLRGHFLTPVPSAALEVAYAPAAHAGCDAWSPLYVDARYEQVLYASSRVGSEQLLTLASDARFGFGYRLAFSRFFVDPSIHYDLRRIELGGDYVPDFGYRTLRLGLFAGVQLASVIVELGGAYHVIEHAGELTDNAWFPLARGYGYELEARLGLRLSRTFSVVVSGHTELRTFTLNPQPPYGYPHGIAGALDDRIVSTELSLRWAPSL